MKDYTELNGIVNTAVDDIRTDIKRAYDKGYAQGTKDVEKDYQRGLDDAWDAAKKIVLDTTDGGFSVHELNEIFHTCTASEAFINNTATEAMTKIKKHEEGFRIADTPFHNFEIGDEVEGSLGKWVIVFLADRFARGIDADGNFHTDLYVNLKKTGRKYPGLSGVMRQIKEG